MHVLAEITPKPEHFDAAEAAILSIVERTREEAGCHRFEVYTTLERDVLVLIEHWADKAAFDFHHAQPYTAEIFRKYENWLAAEPRIVPLRTPDQERQS